MEKLRSNPGRFDLVILDMAMPNMSGDQLIKDLLKIRTDIPIIISIGFSEKINGQKAKGGGAVGYIEKSLSMRELSSTSGFSALRSLEFDLGNRPLSFDLAALHLRRVCSTFGPKIMGTNLLTNRGVTHNRHVQV